MISKELFVPFTRGTSMGQGGTERLRSADFGIRNVERISFARFVGKVEPPAHAGGSDMFRVYLRLNLFRVFRAFRGQK